MKPFRHALAGIIHAVRTERNVKLHLVSLALVVLAAWWLPTTKFENLLLTVWVTVVLVAELLNTAVERTVDLVTAEHRPLAKQAKDVAAGAVLVASIGALLSACMIFIPYVLMKF